MTLMGSSSPKRVIQASSGIKAIIDAGEPGDRLPSEAELAQRVGVSRVTVREALQLLWVRGLVTRRWGAGTFISERHSVLDAPANRIFLDLEEIQPLPTMLAESGHVPSIAAYTSTVVTPPEWVRAAFGLSAADEVRLIERCIAIDDQPAQVLRDYVPLLLRGQELHFDGLQEMRTDFPRIFREAGLRLVKQVEQLSGALPDARVAELLGIATSEPVLRANQHGFAENGETVICTDSYYMTSLVNTVLVRTIAN